MFLYSRDRVKAYREDSLYLNIRSYYWTRNLELDSILRDTYNSPRLDLKDYLSRILIIKVKRE